MLQAVWVYINNEMINLVFSWYRSCLMFYGQIVGFIFNFWWDLPPARNMTTQLAIIYFQLGESRSILQAPTVL
jgi:hypothetical protein